MPSPNVVAGAARLKHAFQALRDRWREVEPTWDDAARRRFEDRYIAPIGPGVDAALVAIQKIGEVLDRARRDGADPDRSDSP